MFYVACGIIGLMLLIVGGLFVSIVIRQKELDIPCKGLLVVDRQDAEGPCLVYLEATVDPATFTDGEMVKLTVTHVYDKSHQKQGA